MSSKDNNRESLLKAATLVRAALATRDYIPILTHIKFDGKTAVAYNDISALGVRCLLDIDLCLPGELLIKALSTFSGDSIAMAEGKNGAIVLSSGRSKVTLPSMPSDKFPLELPRKNAHEIVISKGILQGIARCLLSVNTDPTHPATMGITLDIDEGGRAVLYSTDSYCISRFSTDTGIELPGDTPVIMPTFFCEQLLRMANTFPEAEIALLLHDGALVAEFGNDLAWIFQRTVVDLEPFDFPSAMKKHCDLSKLEKSARGIPPGFDEALDRALMMLTNETDKATEIEVGEDGLVMRTESSLGIADDKLKFDSPDDRKFLIDPTMLARGTKACAKIAFMDRVVVMADDKLQFVHMIGHVTGSKK